MAMTLSALVTLLLAVILPIASAQSCPVDGPWYYDFAQGTCNSDPSNPAYLQILFAPASTWSTHVTFSARATFRDAGGVMQIYTGFPQTTWAADGSNTATMNFDVPLSAIPSGSVVTQRAYITQGGSCFWSGSAFYTQIHQATAKTTDSYTTITRTVPETTTSTSTLLETALETATPPEVTATSVTGYKTVLAKRVTSTTTSTITPRPFTKYAVTVTKTTTTVTCIGGNNNRRALNERRRAILERQDKRYEMPSCGPVRTTTIYTSTIEVPATTTTTETAVAYTTETTTSTTEAPTPTSYTSVRGTTTLTPTRIVTRWSILRPSVVTSSKVFTITVTRFPGNKIPKKCTSSSTKPTPVGPICTPARFQN